jgi:hypothetical protein
MVLDRIILGRKYSGLTNTVKVRVMAEKQIKKANRGLPMGLIINF